MSVRETTDLYAGFAAAAWPPAADRGRAKIQAERWIDAIDGLDDPGLRKRGRAVSGTPAGRTVLDAVFGNSPYLGDSMVDDPVFALDLLRRGPDQVLAGLIADLRA